MAKILLRQMQKIRFALTFTAKVKFAGCCLEKYIVCVNILCLVLSKRSQVQYDSNIFVGERNSRKNVYFFVDVKSIVLVDTFSVRILMQYFI